MSSAFAESGSKRVYQDIAFITLVVNRLAANIRNTESVSICCNAGDDAVFEVTVVSRGWHAKQEGVHHGAWTCSLSDDVSEDPADAGKCALERLDRAWVIMTLDLKRNCPAVAYIDNASMRTGARKCIFAVLR